MNVKSRLVGGALAFAVVAILGISLQRGAIPPAPDGQFAARQLELSDAHQQSARSILEGAHRQAKA